MFIKKNNKFRLNPHIKANKSHLINSNRRRDSHCSISVLRYESDIDACNRFGFAKSPAGDLLRSANSTRIRAAGILTSDRPVHKSCRPAEDINISDRCSLRIPAGENIAPEFRSGTNGKRRGFGVPGAPPTLTTGECVRAVAANAFRSSVEYISPARYTMGLDTIV